MPTERSSAFAPDLQDGLMSSTLYSFLFFLSFARRETPIIHIMSSRFLLRRTWQASHGSRRVVPSLSSPARRWGSSISQRPGSDRYGNTALLRIEGFNGE